MEENKNGKDISVSQRQIYILSLLSENPKGYQIDEIRQRLLAWDIEVSKRTLSRDIDELSLNYGIGEEERNGKTYFFADKYTLKNVDLTIEDLASLAFAKEMLKQYEYLHMGQHAISLLNRVVEQSTSLNQLQFDSLAGFFKQVGVENAEKNSVNVEIEKQIKNAIENQNKVEIAYYSFSSDENRTRVIHPFRILLIDSYVCVEGYCELRKEVRRFRLSRIKSLNVLDQKFQYADEDKNFVNSFWKLQGNRVEELELFFTGDSVRYVKEYEVGKSKQLFEEGKGLCFVSEVAITSEVIRWVRGFGAEVEVRKPSWLKERIIEDAKKILDA